MLKGGDDGTAEVSPSGLKAGLTSDYGSASDVITHQMSGSRTGPLSSLEEDASSRSRSPRARRDSDGTKTDFDTGSKDMDPSSLQASVDLSKSVDIGDIAVDMSTGSGKADGSIGDGNGVSFETWPPKDTEEGKIDLAGHEEGSHVLFLIYMLVK